MPYYVSGRVQGKANLNMIDFGGKNHGIYQRSEEISMQGSFNRLTSAGTSLVSDNFYLITV